jgi:hypothetical protein
MVHPKIKYGERIPILLDQASQLLSLANEMVSICSVPYDTNDFIGPILDAFTHKHIDHLRSICIL